MLVDVYHHRHWDQMNSRNIIIPWFSTEDRIKNTRGEIIPETKRQIDEHLIDSDGNAISKLNSEDWKNLRDLASLKGQRTTIS
jgi:hypothetical protein